MSPYKFEVEKSIAYNLITGLFQEAYKLENGTNVDHGSELREVVGVDEIGCSQLIPHQIASHKYLEYYDEKIFM